MEQGNRELHQGIAKQKAANAKLCCETDEHRAAAEQARDLLDKATGDLSRMSGEIERLRAESAIREDGVRQAKGDVGALQDEVAQLQRRLALKDAADIAESELERLVGAGIHRRFGAQPVSRTIYVAGGSDERDECKAAMLALQAAGWTITFDWTAHPGDMRGDIRGVLDAVYLWVRCPRTKSEGSHAELGIAIGAGAVEPAARRRIIVVSGTWRDLGRLFTKAADLTFNEHEQALTWLLEMAP